MKYSNRRLELSRDSYNNSLYCILCTVVDALEMHSYIRGNRHLHKKKGRACCRCATHEVAAVGPLQEAHK